MNPKLITVDYIKKQLRLIYAKIPLKDKELATDCLFDSIASLQNGDYKTAYHTARKLYQLSKTPVEETVNLFNNLLFAEDVVKSDSVVFIHRKSPYKQSLLNLANALGFKVQEHEFHPSKWTKDYLISTGTGILIPVKNKKGGYLTSQFVESTRNNSALYYGPLGLAEHHKSKANLLSTRDWGKSAREQIDQPTFLHHTVLEGGNFFCAINKRGERYYLLGENVVSETMAYNDLTREAAISIILEELACPDDKLLIIPQWTYHLDLQMAYLGHGQFVIHSFDQQDFDFGLGTEVSKKVAETFDRMNELFEKNVIDVTCNLLNEHGFEVSKVFGCLFYLNDFDDLKERQYIPYCKNDDSFGGALASTMNGIALDLGPKGRYFIMARCDQIEFRQQYEQSLRKLGIREIHDADMLEAYDYSGEFESILLGIMGAKNVTEVAAFMTGALRCQTSIVSQLLCHDFAPEMAIHRFFKRVEHMDLEQGSLKQTPEPKSEPSPESVKYN